MTNSIDNIASDIVSGNIASEWQYYAILFGLLLLSSVLGSLIAGYYQKRGENLATKADFKDILDQLRQTTHATECIRTDISHNNWRNEKQWELRHSLFLSVIDCLGRWRMLVIKGANLLFNEDGSEKERNTTALDAVISDLKIVRYEIGVLATKASLALSKESIDRIRGITDAINLFKSETGGGHDRRAILALGDKLRDIADDIACQAKQELMGE